MSERDMMYGGYYQNIPGNISYGNFGYQGMPGSLMPMQGMMPNNQYIMNNDSNNIIARINSLESRVKALEQRVNDNISSDDNSLYML